MLLKVTTGTLSNKHNFPDDCTLRDLQLFIEEKTGIADFEMDLLVGYPPTLLQHQSISGDALLSTLGFQSGSVVTVRPNDQLRALAHQLTEMGFSRTIVKQCFALISSADLDTCVEICTQLTDEPAARGPLVRKVVPADNSCLFNSIGFLAEQPNYDQCPSRYRQLVADYILAHKEDYSAHLLDGKEAEHYARWILNSDKWGGEVEVSVLSAVLGLQISVVDIRTSNTYTYGAEHGYERRMFLLYDGVHYDALMRRHGARTETLFAADDADATRSAEEVGRDLKSKKLFVDLAHGQFQCGVCHAVLCSERDAVAHAKVTGHQNFSQS